MNFELMRAISMMMIVFWHVLCKYGRGYPSTIFASTTGGIHFGLNVIYILFTIHVNSFVLVSGYFNCEKEFSKKQFLKVFLASWFYRVLFVILFTLLGYEKFPSLSFLKQIFILDINSNYWFVNIYLALYLFTPFLNLFIKHASQQVHRRLLLVSFIVLSMIPSFTNMMTISSVGTDVLFFMFLYMIGAYFKKYPIEENAHFKKYSRRKLRNILLFLAIGCGLLNVLLEQYGGFLASFENSLLSFLGRTISSFICNYNNPIVIVQSVFYFLFFSTISIHGTIKNKILSFLSPAIFGVYLIHFNSYVRTYVFSFLGIDPAQGPFSKIIIIKVILYVIGLFFLSIFIEKARLFVAKQIKSLWQKRKKKRMVTA